MQVKAEILVFCILASVSDLYRDLTASEFELLDLLTLRDRNQSGDFFQNLVTITGLEGNFRSSAVDRPGSARRSIRFCLSV